ncbi:hypothetical protein HKW98_06915 [Stutzerimonas urumqiensis]|uniref:hypothetical protein n=1 Tax=Stutzerimonas urumqiensis TaxID=638269 RepID=UPI003BAA64C9
MLAKLFKTTDLRPQGAFAKPCTGVFAVGPGFLQGLEPIEAFCRSQLAGDAFKTASLRAQVAFTNLYAGVFSVACPWRIVRCAPESALRRAAACTVDPFGFERANNPELHYSYPPGHFFGC